MASGNAHLLPIAMRFCGKVVDGKSLYASAVSCNTRCGVLGSWEEVSIIEPSFFEKDCLIQSFRKRDIQFRKIGQYLSLSNQRLVHTQ
jgi:hypothetical protein